MSLPLFFAAEAAQPGVVDGLKNTFEHFGVEPKLIIIQIVSFLIVLAVLYKFAIKPTIATMEERNSKIASGLKNAEETAAKLAAAQQESAAIIKKAQVEATRIIGEATKTATDAAEKKKQEAVAAISAMQTKAQQDLDLQQKKMLADARAEIARLVVATTERVLAKKLTDADRAAYNETAARELANV